MTKSDAKIDQRIILAVQQGNKLAFAELYDRHNAWLMAVAFRILNNRRDAEDLLHDVFIEIWKKASSYDQSRGSLKSWLAVKIRSRALDRLRTLSNLKKHEAEQMNEEITAATMSTSVTRSVEEDQAKRMLQQLTPMQRNIIELSYFRGFTCQEIANHCQMPLGTVKSDLLRSMKALRNNLKQCEFS